MRNNESQCSTAPVLSLPKGYERIGRCVRSGAYSCFLDCSGALGLWAKPTLEDIKRMIGATERSSHIPDVASVFFSVVAAADGRGMSSMNAVNYRVYRGTMGGWLLRRSLCTLLYALCPLHYASPTTQQRTTFSPRFPSGIRSPPRRGARRAGWVSLPDIEGTCSALFAWNTQIEAGRRPAGEKGARRTQRRAGMPRPPM